MERNMYVSEELLEQLISQEILPTFDDLKDYHYSIDDMENINAATNNESLELVEEFYYIGVENNNQTITYDDEFLGWVKYNG